jgi:putative SOS response-associated peptidase YedK
MCGRFTLLTLGQFTDLFPWIRMPVRSAEDAGSGRYNISPSQNIAVVANDGANQIDFYRWGLVPFWAKDPAIGNRMINARSESIAAKPAFREAFRLRRCLVPADGFFEWKQHEKGGRGKIPLRIRMRSHQPFAFAGLWERWRDPAGGGELHTCTIVTCAANDLLRPIHDRMPVILRPEDYRRWIDPAPADPKLLQPMLAPFDASAMEAYAVGTTVNKAGNESPQCIEPVAGDAPAAPSQPGLFD